MKNLNNEYYVYIYKDPINGIPVYVGKGHGDRALRHLNSSHNKKLSSFIHECLEHDRPPVIETFMQPDQETAFEEEKRLITKFGRLDKKTGTLFNKTDGGQVVPKFTRTPQYKKNLSQAMMGNQNAKGSNNHGTLVNHTEESKKRIRDTQKARWAKIRGDKDGSKS